MIYTIEEALEDIKIGKPIIVIDDENRENEGDFFVAAEKVNYEAINLMTKYGKGLICTPLSQEYAKRLFLEPMTANNTDAKCTAFTVSVDYKYGTTTGISVADRLLTIQKLAGKNTKADDFTRPGHIFPLTAKKGGVLVREGHTEAAVDLCKISGLAEVGVICEILKDDGTMARLDDLEIFAKEHSLKIITIEDLIKYRKKTEELMKIEVETNLPTDSGTFRMVGFENYIDGKEHIALVKGNVRDKEAVSVRIHSECFTGDILGSLRCDCGSQLKTAMRRIDRLGEGVILYLRQEGRGIGLLNKMRAYNLQEQGVDTLDANLQLGFGADMRDYAVAAQMLKALGVRSVKLLTNNPLKIQGLKDYGIDVIEREEIEIEHNKVNRVYLKTKKDRMGHLLKIK
ncbi:bifunctional 3,4-dihydroxy-2-butanone-4-phosphate synthase/GTP cyclohydrolase II [Fusobacterium gastrosuis]|uniref:bifunctional 3,4-dihydroxy-2-butanone-4-phosphate synthase/GTP cyclohydrolase II n=1 Tax=Fusobacterium gastrosuis TaxID=1755100 RepID=UPI002970482B|nr:bifunctional 3,4-dihydroxy-2-butanone-4-phosphate synthase/GTP cyclohydrolase II [Fusobacteriaceae bacterium]MDY5712633.1 bifunctional 3,4-dihydroxy-2-butanone-4-phosphate synthase/GTP cyclohydrolase II [Fusobacterium gastrosuis]